ncbi:hypothetical protein [uncultured Dokdonia sp.]|uniref:hypothetical protein n=1 Tax=uncultured Dokdonia sp. TaxID=575653 RepID=UPI0026113705|nr:hypothetical protein [uncultured Dokdonia sp.]
MLAGKIGVAIFSTTLDAPSMEASYRNIKIDHFAFHVSMENFAKARKKYKALQLEYIFRDHIHFHSIYTKDPDGQTVELTTIIGDSDIFYT